MAVAYLPYGQPQKHFSEIGDVSLADVEWPLNDRPHGDHLSDLSEDDHVLMMSSSRVLSLRQSRLKCPVSVLLGEPPVIQRRLYAALPWFASKFQHVFTHHTEMLQRLSNGTFLAFGGTFIPDDPIKPFPEKPSRISLIASSKNCTSGHRLRHRIVKWSKRESPDLNALGLGYQPIEDKADGHLPYLFSVVIENTQSPGWFTEKLIDSLLCHSLPIYWGAPDIGHFFDPRGMIRCRNEWELKKAIQSLTQADFDRRRRYLEENRLRALEYLDYPCRAAEFLAGAVSGGSSVGGVGELADRAA
ncbi:MAG: glycosyltransferase family 1 protein [Fuerstiella sp.]|jgi:hypothetical protein|nr:glycosyltransferase family 1 protein [Fuerstiella sp.]MDG2126616.1 hypothetical protein [Fuerstiella sp.]